MVTGDVRNHIVGHATQGAACDSHGLVLHEWAGEPVGKLSDQVNPRTRSQCKRC